MRKALIVIGGVFNSFFALFHVLLSWGIHRTTGLPPAVKSLMEMLGISGMLMFFFFAFASLLCWRDLLTTRLGRMVITLIAVVYLSRAAEEVLLTTRISPLIFGSCLLVGIIYTLALFPGGAERLAGASAD